MRFTRLSSSTSIFQAHASEDSKFVLLPIIEKASRISGWVVYKTQLGDISEEIFPTISEARNWVIKQVQPVAS